eukprot:gene35150-42574_t
MTDFVAILKSLIDAGVSKELAVQVADTETKAELQEREAERQFQLKMMKIQLEIAKIQSLNGSKVGDLPIEEVASKSASGTSTPRNRRSPPPYSPVVSPNTTMSVGEPLSIESEDNSKYFKILKHFGGKAGYRFSMIGPLCLIVGPNSAVPICSFPYTKQNLCNACFLFLSESNYLELMTAVDRNAIRFKDY